MATFLKQIQQDQKRIIRDENISNVFTMAFGSELTFTYLNSVNDAGFKSNRYNSLFLSKTITQIFNFYY